MWHQIIKALDAHQHFLLTTHLNPDADGIGAGSALIELLLQMGKKVRFVCDSPIPPKFAFLDYHQLHECYDEQEKYPETEVLIILDANRLERIGRLANLVPHPNILTLCIDHHEPVPPQPFALCIDPHACSVGAMIFRLYKETGYKLNFNAANGIYASILYDTGRFSYSSTNRNAHRIAEECIRLGVDPVFIHNCLFQQVSVPEAKLFASALQKMETFFDHKIAIQQIRQAECAADVADIEHIDLEYVHDFNYMIKDVQCFVLLREISQNLVRVSLRSKTALDISQIVQQLGGGGHANAGGIYWKGPIEEIKYVILDQLTALLSKQAPQPILRGC